LLITLAASSLMSGCICERVEVVLSQWVSVYVRGEIRIYPFFFSPLIDRFITNHFVGHASVSLTTASFVSPLFLILIWISFELLVIELASAFLLSGLLFFILSRNSVLSLNSDDVPLGEWMSEWVGEWMSEWVGEWVGECLYPLVRISVAISLNSNETNKLFVDVVLKSIPFQMLISCLIKCFLAFTLAASE
jgi:hypothetical protein